MVAKVIKELGRKLNEQKEVLEVVSKEICDTVQETGIKTIPMEKKCKKQNGCLRRPYK